MERYPQLPPFDTGDFARRWEKARIAALRSALPSSLPGAVPEEEAALLEYAFAPGGEGDGAAVEKLLRAVFDNSRRLGTSLAVRLGVTFEVQDLQSLLAAADPPCLRGAWSERPRARVLERPGCDFASAAGAGACDYWREALDGLVTGLGDRERLARHACARRGDGACVDVIFREEGGPADAEAWAPVPDHMAIDLLEASEQLRRKAGVAVELKGVNEGVLHFSFAGTEGGGCAPGAGAVRLFEELVRARFPGLRLRDITPKAVLAPAGAP